MAKKSNFSEQKCPYCGGISRSQFHPTDYCFHCGRYIGYTPPTPEASGFILKVLAISLIVVIAIIVIIGYFLITWIF